MSKANFVHWADIAADRIIRQHGDKEQYTLASGITPSGVVHFGNFREVITVDLIARALKDRGKKVRFIFSWDDFDTLRKIPDNMPKQEMLQEHMYRPIVNTPDPYEEEDSYAAHHEKSFEEQLKKVGIAVEPLYQAHKYKKGEYKDQIKKTLSSRDEIVEILNKHRKEPLTENWLPLSVYCEKCDRDRIKEMKFDGDTKISYTCELCGHEGEEDLKTSSRVKLPWRIDWPMRWDYEKVDFEPGGKDHSSEGGSYTTAKEIVSKVFGRTPPVYLQYDFVSIKGAGGKMSSSSGNIITVNDVLNIYEPEMVRWIFASYKTNVDFSVGFDLDVLKTYEDFDRTERVAFGLETVGEKKRAIAKRIYEFSQLQDYPKECPFQPSFRHLCNILQINDGDINKARKYYADLIKNDRDERRFEERANRALFWLDNYAPEEFKFKINSSVPAIEISDTQRLFLNKLNQIIANEWGSISSDKELNDKIYELIHELKIEDPKEIFQVLYEILISKPKGPKVASFIRTIGKEKVSRLLMNF